MRWTCAESLSEYGHSALHMVCVVCSVSVRELTDSLSLLQRSDASVEKKKSHNGLCQSKTLSFSFFFLSSPTPLLHRSSFLYRFLTLSICIDTLPDNSPSPFLSSPLLLSLPLRRIVSNESPVPPAIPALASTPHSRD